MEEFSTSNFIAISQSGAYVTPKSPSILPSVTNRSLRQIALDMGMEVEEREVAYEEVLPVFLSVGDPNEMCAICETLAAAAPPVPCGARCRGIETA
eukprot:COSAG01_NODE_21002_length_923_cov_0.702670_2_plen_96_part_00